ncbi:LOW QUALITY PROTEIN: spermatogenesis-associated protein 31D3-like [Dipodomys spectabilis]|uniref:LOW QUALITY PROTEIN: spermatogenesis-associated protein 31D3-like n=1 Tax=Dipodomys spectabilis TaxID=105255 RepID=UPI001C542BC8|nr:LOW QUALITY PROTEIN: spermatogenesis-associated protein 31D3-like [Dipodomys spectabilis]
MGNILSFLNEPWLCFGSSLLDIDTKYTLLGQRPLRKEAEEEQKLLSVVSSLLDKHPNTTRFRKLLCPDPLCQVCGRTAAEASHLLSQASVKVAASSGELDVTSPLPCELVECEAKWESLALHSSEASSEGVAASYHIEPSDYSLKFVFFNIISNVFTAHKSPVIPDPKLLPLPEIHSQVLPETLHQDHLGAQAQAQLQSLLLGLPSSPEPQIRACGVCFHGLQSEVQLLTPSEIHHLEYNILQKKQENVWGLPSVVQRSQEDFCFPAPKLPLVRQYSKAKVMVSILPGDFPLNSGLQQKLEHHLRKRLIQQHWGLPRRIQESLSLMSPRIETPQSSESKISEGLSWISSFKHQKSKHPNFESSQLESSEKSIEISLLDEECDEKEEGTEPAIQERSSQVSEAPLCSLLGSGPQDVGPDALESLVCMYMKHFELLLAAEQASLQAGSRQSLALNQRP